LAIVFLKVNKVKIIMGMMILMENILSLY